MFYKNVNCTNIQVLYLSDHTHTPTIQTIVPRGGDNPNQKGMTLDPSGLLSKPAIPLALNNIKNILFGCLLSLIRHIIVPDRLPLGSLPTFLPLFLETADSPAMVSM